MAKNIFKGNFPITTLIIGFLILFLMAYFLGVTISGIVDNRLIQGFNNMPRPIIKIVDGDNIALQSSTRKLKTTKDYILENFEDKKDNDNDDSDSDDSDSDDSDSDKDDDNYDTDNNSDTIKTPLNKGEITDKKYIKYEKDKNQNNANSMNSSNRNNNKNGQIVHELEPQVDRQTLPTPLAFKYYPSSYWQNPNFTIDNPVIAETRAQYDKVASDLNAKSYADSYKKQEEIFQFQLSKVPYVPYNSEDLDSEYMPIQKGEYTPEKSNQVTPFNEDPNDTKVILAARSSNLLPRDQRPPDFKCQRLTDNCTTTHHPKVFYTPKDKDGKYEITPSIEVFNREKDGMFKKANFEDQIRLKIRDDYFNRMNASFQQENMQAKNNKQKVKNQKNQKVKK